MVKIFGDPVALFCGAFAELLGCKAFQFVYYKLKTLDEEWAAIFKRDFLICYSVKKV